MSKKKSCELFESKYNNLYFSPEIVETYKTTVDIIKKIYYYNNHLIDKRLATDLPDDWEKLKDTSHYTYIFVDPSPILLHINTNHRISIIDTFPLMDTILLSKVPIYTIIDSVCRDTMLLPFLVGKKRYMYENAHIYFTTNFYDPVGNTSLEDKLNNLTTISKKITSIFKKYTKLPPDIYKIIFKRELFLNAEDCLKYGIIDCII